MTLPAANPGAGEASGLTVTNILALSLQRAPSSLLAGAWPWAAAAAVVVAAGIAVLTLRRRGGAAGTGEGSPGP